MASAKPAARTLAKTFDRVAAARAEEITAFLRSESFNG
jgi:hypothetical protein